MNSKFLLLTLMAPILIKSSLASLIECYHCNIWTDKCDDEETLTCRSSNLKANCYVALVKNKTSGLNKHMKGCVMSDFKAFQPPCQELNHDINRDNQNKALEVLACYSCQYDKCNSYRLTASAGSNFLGFRHKIVEIFALFLYSFK